MKDETVLLDNVTASDSNSEGVSMVYDISNGKVLSELKSSKGEDIRYLRGVTLDSANGSNELYFTYTNNQGDSILSHVDSKGNLTDDVLDITKEVGAGALDEEGNYYYISEGNIVRVVPGGSIKEQIMDDNNFIIGRDDVFTSSMICFDAETFVVLATEGDRNKIVRYNLDENVVSDGTSEPTADGTKTLVIWSLSNNDSIRSAISKAKEEISDVEIEYQIGTSNGVTAEDAIKQLKADIMSGGGPDVILLDGLDYENFENKGYLYELSEIDTTELLPGIIDGMRTDDGKLYVIPAKFNVPVMVGMKGEIEEIDSLETLKEDILSKPARTYTTPFSSEFYEEWTKDKCYGIGVEDLDDLVDFTMQSSAGQMINDGEISEDNLRTVVDFVASVASYYHMEDYQPVEERNTIVLSMDNGADSVTIHDGLYEYNTTGHAVYGWEMMETPACFAVGNLLTMPEAEVNYIYRPGLCEYAYIPSSILGITAGSKNKEAALSFIQIMLTEEVQDSSAKGGLSVNMNALQTSIDRHQEVAQENNYYGDMMEFYKMAKTRVAMGDIENYLKESIIKHVDNILNGTEDVDSAVDGIKADMDIILKEQQ